MKRYEVAVSSKSTGDLSRDRRGEWLARRRRSAPSTMRATASPVLAGRNGGRPGVRLVFRSVRTELAPEARITGRALLRQQRYWKDQILAAR